MLKTRADGEEMLNMEMLEGRTVEMLNISSDPICALEMDFKIYLLLNRYRTKYIYYHIIIDNIHYAIYNLTKK